MGGKLPEEFGAVLGSVTSANIFMFAQLFKMLIDKNILDDDDLRKFLSDVEKAGWDQKAGQSSDYLPALLVMIEQLRRDLLREEPERRV